MNDDTTDPTPVEIDAGRGALHELAATTAPADVVARLERRLAREPGLAPPVRRSARWRRPRLALVAPGFGVALAAVVAIVVISSQGGSGAPPTPDAAGTRLSQAPAFKAQTQAKAADGAAAVAPAPSVPDLVGRSAAGARALARTEGLRIVLVGASCPAGSHARIVRQQPKAGLPAPPGSTVRIRLGGC